VNTRIQALGFPRPPIRFESIFAPKISTLAATHLFQNRVQTVIQCPSTGGVALPSTPASQEFVNPGALSDRLELVRNQAGQRIDKELVVDINAPYAEALRRSQLCSWYYLRGKCVGCKKVHSVSALNGRQFDCLWYFARQNLCHKIRKGKDCDDRLCIYGHKKG